MTGTVVVTGASRGLGAAVVRAFLRDGATVVGCSRHQEELAALADSPDGPGELTVQRADVRDEFDVERLMESATRLEGGIDAVVANAGVYHGTAGETPLVDDSYASFDDHVRANGRGVFASVKEAVPHLTGDARIVVPTGAVARNPTPGYGSYAASKALAEAVVRQFAVELDVPVGLVDPGRLSTRLGGGESGRDPDAVAGLVTWAATEAPAEDLDGSVLDVEDWHAATDPPERY